MTTSEPTTGEIVRALRYCVGKDTICGTACPAYLSEAGCRTTIMKNSADRLESQEREIERLQKTIDRQDAVCYALTARAEQAERERDAAVAVIGIQAEKLKESHVVLCNICEFEDMIGCVHKNHCDGYQLFKWRGAPQEGEGKK